jgi:hypothetical protein
MFPHNPPGQLRFLLQKIKLESGSEIVHQSHKNHLSAVLIDSFIRMAHSEKLGLKSNSSFTPEGIDELYASGIAKLQQYYMEGKNGLDRFKPFSPGIMLTREQEKEEQNEMICSTEEQQLSDASSEAGPTSDQDNESQSDQENVAMGDP